MLTKDISCECKCKFDGRKCNSNQWWNNDKFDVSEKKRICEKDYIWNPVTCSCENGKYLASIMDDSVIRCEEVINVEAKSYDEETKTVPINFNEKKQPARHKISIFYLHFY